MAKKVQKVVVSSNLGSVKNTNALLDALKEAAKEMSKMSNSADDYFKEQRERQREKDKAEEEAKREAERKKREQEQEQEVQDAKNSKADKIRAAFNVIKSINDIFFELYQTDVDITLNKIETFTDISQQRLSMLQKSFNGVITSSFTSLTQGSTEGSYAAASAAVDNYTAMEQFKMNEEMNMLQMKNYEKTRRADALGSVANNSWAAIGAIIGVAAGGPVGLAIGAGVGMVIQEASKWYTSVIKNDAKMEEKKLKQLQEIKKNALETSQSIQKDAQNFTKTIEDSLGKHQEAAKEIQSTTGINHSAMASNEKAIFAMQQKIGVIGRDGKWQHLDYDATDMAKAQTGYAEQTGRAASLNQKDYNKLAQMGVLLGSNETAVQLAASLEVFNKSASDSTDLVFDMYKTANRMGLDAKKFSKDLVENLKLANKYSFKNGVKGVMQMAAWSQKVGFNMSSLSGSLEKVSSGGLEGVIKMGAQLQVLGGRAAMNADPLAMMFERYADPKAFAERIHDMTKGLGVFNKKTGETEVSGFNLMMAEELANTLGKSTEDIISEVRRETARAEISKVIKPNKYTEQQLDLISSKAKYNTETQKWQVTGADGVVKDIDDLDSKDFEAMSMDHNETMEQRVADILSELKKISGTAKEGQQSLEGKVQDDWKANVEERIADDRRFYNDASGTLQGIVTENMKFATEMNDAMHEQFNKSASLLTEINNQTIKSAKDMANAIADASSYIWSEIRILHGNETQKDRNAFHLDDFNDGITSGSGNPMYVSASQVTPVHDGYARIAKTDPNDSAVFAKKGGPFDTLFNGIFGKVLDIADAVVPPILPQPGKLIKSVMALAAPEEHPSSDAASQMKQQWQKAEASSFEVYLHGEIMLKTENGRSFDISRELENNPMLIRALSDAIGINISHKFNGGRGKSIYNR